MLEKLFSYLIAVLIVISLMLQVNHLPYAFALLLFSCLAFFWQYMRISFIIQTKLTSTHSEKMNSLAQRILGAENQIRQHKEMALLVIREIERTGNERSVEISEQIDGDAGRALMSLRAKLASYKKEEAARNWVMEGVALIGELRASSNGIEDYANKVMAEVVKYLGVNQGVLYLHRRSDEGDDQMFELAATYAYGKRRYTDKKVLIHPGQGMAGQCILEKEMIFLTQVPKDYVRITSGLGEATPRCVLISPLIFNNQVYGVLEVASFTILQESQIDFLRKVCVNIAGELSAMIIHEHTEMLLRQTMLSQEQMKQKEQQISSKLIEVEAERRKNIAILNGCMDGVISFEEDGIIGFVNVAAAEIFDRRQDEMIGSNIEDLMGVHIVRSGQGVINIISSTGSEITVRTEVITRDNSLSLLLTSTKVKMNEGFLFTLFIQKISVDLF